MKKLIFGSAIILFIIVILIIFISNIIRSKPPETLNQQSFPTSIPHSVSSLSKQKTSTPVGDSSSSTSSRSSITQPPPSKSSTSQPSTLQQRSVSQPPPPSSYTPSDPYLVSQKDKDNLIYLNNFLPYDTDDFSIEYSPILDKYIVTTKGEKGEEVFIAWATENGVLDTLQNPNNAIISKATITEIHSQLPPHLQPTQPPQQDRNETTSQKQISLLMNLFNGFFSLPETEYSGFDYLDPSPTLFLQPSESVSPSVSSPPFQPSTSPQPSISPQTGGGYVYYAQNLPPYASYPLNSTKTLKQCGCGPTSVAMILASYVNKSYTPITVTDIYTSQNRNQCGTSMGSAKKILGEQGATTSDYIIPYYEPGFKIELVADDMKSYLRNGWTIFVLASFSNSSALNHFFWITNIDDQNNVYAYDPYYGAGKIPPINQNTRYPYPKYLAAFGVKK